MLSLILVLLVAVWPTYAESKTFSDQQMYCLAKNVYFEAGIEPVEGWEAVVYVTLNRLESKKHPNTICNVVYQGVHRNGLPVKNKCQFSWYCDGKPDKYNKALFNRIKTVVERAVRSYYSADFIDTTDNATYYHADYVRPYWRKWVTRTAKIGRHIFYRDDR